NASDEKGLAASKTQSGNQVSSDAPSKLPSSIGGLELTKDEYLAAVKDGLWEKIQGDPKKGYKNNREVDAASNSVNSVEVEKSPDVVADPELARFSKDIARSTATAKISGPSQEFEKSLTFGRSSNGEVVVTGIAVQGSQGGRFTLPEGTIGVAHV